MFHRLFLPLTLLLAPLYAEVPQGTDLSGLNEGLSFKRYRERVFHAYKPRNDLKKQLKVYKFSCYENPTGIFFRQGEHISIELLNEPAAPVKLIVCDFLKDGKESSYPLHKGVNKIKLANQGLGYIDYRHKDGCKAPTISVKLHGGTINGIFSQHDDVIVWRSLLRDMPAGVLDMVGDRCHIVYTAQALREYTGDRGEELLDFYDRIVEVQQTLLGWERDGIHPGNHVMIRAVWENSLHCDDKGAAIGVRYLDSSANLEIVSRNAWAAMHELGHVHQGNSVGIRWASMTEISVNIFTMCCSYELHPHYCRLEHFCPPNADGKNMRGGDFDLYVNHYVREHRLWQTGNFWSTLCPLWQLELYCHVARGNENFYPEIFRLIRAVDDNKTSHGQARLNFCRFASKSAGMNLSYYLMRAGMLCPISRIMGDYGRSFLLEVSPEMVEAAVKEASQYPEPDSSVIFYINVNNVGIYRDRLPVKPSEDFRPRPPRAGGEIFFPSDKWENAVAFEVYKGDKLVRICLRGLGQEDNASTTVICPPGSTCIRAVQWDGTRYRVSP